MGKRETLISNYFKHFAFIEELRVQVRLNELCMKIQSDSFEVAELEKTNEVMNERIMTHHHMMDMLAVAAQSMDLHAGVVPGTLEDINGVVQKL